MDPNDLRDCVREAIVDLIEPMAWARCDAVNRAETGVAQRRSRRLAQRQFMTVTNAA